MGRQLTWRQYHSDISSAGNQVAKPVAEAIRERDRFLKRYPQYKAYQREIDHLLDEAGPPEKRMAVLAMLMEGKLLEMRDQLQGLNTILINTAS